MAQFSRNLDHPQYLIHPSVDPLAEKNRPLTQAEEDEALSRFGLDRSRPLIAQVSRFDRFKDPVGVIQAFRMVKRRDDCVLVLAGGAADDDPEGTQVLQEVTEAADGDPDIRILNLPPDSNTEINALQRVATVVVQTPVKEGFGLTVSEELWKGRPVIGGAVGGITQQISTIRPGSWCTHPRGLPTACGICSTGRIWRR